MAPQHICLLLLCLCLSNFQNISSASIPESGYSFGYKVHNDDTGDYKTQEETRRGDSVKGRYTVAEPNGDLRVVTYTADQHTGFNAQVEVQPGGSPLRSAETMMKSPPRSHQRSGFGPVRPKVTEEELRKLIEKIEIAERQEEINLKEIDGVKEEVLQNETTKEGTEVPAEKPAQETEKTEGVESNNSTLESEKPKEVFSCTMKCIKTVANQRIKKESEDSSELTQDRNEGRAHIRPNEDKVQVEMEQIIRAEMQDPTTVKLGVPLDGHHRHYTQVKYETPQETISFHKIPILLTRDSNSNRQSTVTTSKNTELPRMTAGDAHKPKTLFLTQKKPGSMLTTMLTPQPGILLPFVDIKSMFNPMFRPGNYPIQQTYKPGLALVVIPPSHSQQQQQPQPIYNNQYMLSNAPLPYDTSNPDNLNFQNSPVPNNFNIQNSPPAPNNLNQHHPNRPITHQHPTIHIKQ